MFDYDGFLITENKSDFRTTDIIAEILEQSWDSFYSKYKEQLDKIRPNCNKEINKIIKCHNHDLGATVYYCEEDNEVYFCHHTCKGKLCSHCGIKSQKTKVLNIMSKCINTNHRHITFTIPEDLRIWFRDDLYITNILYESVCDTIYSIVNGKVSLKRKYDLKYMPGFFSFLHTFGRDLKFNPHIHLIFCEGLLDINNNFKKINYLNYDALSKRFMKILLDKMETFFGKDKFYQTKRNMYKKYPNGFYVNNKLEDNGITFHNHKDLKAFTTDLKSIYTSRNEKEGYEKLQEVKEKWKDKYASAFKIWESNWDTICPFFQFSEPIRKIMYTTNTIESLNRQFRKYTKTKSVFPTDMSLLKCLYLSVKNIDKKWDQAYRNWGPILSELSIMFDNRI